MGGILIGVLNDLGMNVDIINQLTSIWESMRKNITVTYQNN